MKRSRHKYTTLISWCISALLLIVSGYTLAEAQPEGYSQLNLSDLLLSEEVIEQLADPNLQLTDDINNQLLNLNPGFAKVAVSRQNSGLIVLEFNKTSPEGMKMVELSTDPQRWLITQLGDQVLSPQERVANWLMVAEQPQISGIELIQQNDSVYWKITAELSSTANAGIGPPSGLKGPPPELTKEPGQAGPQKDKAAGGFAQKVLNSGLVVNFKKGGFIMYIILMCSVGGLYIALERAYVLRRKRLIPDKFVQDVLKRFSKEYAEHKQDELIKNISEYCEDKDLPIARSLKAGLMVYNEGILGVKSAISSSNAHEGAIMEKGVGLLGVFANITPLLGLLGTVTGMIKAFEMIAIGGGGRAEVVASGISEALITTAGGLFVGIPLLMLYSVFQSKIDNILIDLEEFALEVIEKLIVRAEEIGD